MAFEEEGDHHLAMLSLLPSIGTPPLLLLCSRTIFANLLPSSRTGLWALISSGRLPRRVGTGRLLTPARRLRRLWPTVDMLSIWRSRRVGDHHQATLPLLPPAGILPLLLPCSRTILATLLPPSRTGLQALFSNNRLPRPLKTRVLLTPARRLRRLGPTDVMLSIW